MSSSAENRAASGRTVRHSALNAPPAHGVFNAVASKNVFLAWSDAPRRACATEPFRADLYNNKSCSAALRRQLLVAKRVLVHGYLGMHEF